MNKIPLLLMASLLFASCASQKIENREVASDHSKIVVRDRLVKPQGDKDRKKLLKSLKGFYDNSSAEIIPAIAMIEGARKSIDIEIYEMEDKDFRNALRVALNRGVKIRIIKDPTPVPKPNQCKYFSDITEQDDEECVDQKKLVQEINQSGGKFIPFEKDELCDLDETDPKQISNRCYEHGKIIISDSDRVLISTGNFNSSNLCNENQNPSTCNRDYSYISKDKKVIQLFKTIFEKDLAGKRYKLSKILNDSEKLSEKVTVSPFSLKPLIEFIEKAEKTIDIENQYLKEPNLNEAIVKAAKRGVKVRVTVSSICYFGKPSDKQVDDTKRIYEEFESAGIKTRFFTKNVKIANHKGYMHAKAILLDNSKAWIGSVNGSENALSMNREFGIFTHDKDEVRALKEFIDYDHESPDTESLEETVKCAKD